MAEGVEPLIKARAKLAIPTPFQNDMDYRERRDADTRAWEPARLAQVFRGATLADPTREAISTISCPTLLLAWIDDPVHPVVSAEELQGLIPGSELVVASTRSDIYAWTDRIRDFIS